MIANFLKHEGNVLSNGFIFDIKKFAVHDGPGIRTTVFFKGCPLSCPWCHNPEGQSFSPEIMLVESRCTGCRECIPRCPEHAVSLANGSVRLDREKCTGCWECTAVCPTEALTVVGWKTTVKEIMAEVVRDILFYDESGGGVTLSGGEPLGQPEFLVELLQALRGQGIRTTLDTSGYALWDVVDEIRPLVGLFLYDLKLINDSAHRHYTDVSNGPILENLEKLSKHGSRIVVRVPVVPGISDTKDNMEGIARFVSSLPEKHPIDLLLYHRAGIDKYARLGKEYHLAETNSSTNDEIEAIAKMMDSYGLKVTIGGEPYVAFCADRATAQVESGDETLDLP